MRRLTITKARDTFQKNGKNFFYLADTAWAAIPRASEDEWTEYLDFRKMQGFNAIQMNLLPVMHDKSGMGDDIYPFAMKDSQTMDFNIINPQYFDKAYRMIEEACDKGFIPVVAPLWCNYIEDSWASKFIPGCVMPIDIVTSYIEYVARKFEPLCPVYIISGDTLFETEKLCCYYHTAMKVIKEISPSALTTIHLKPGADLPDDFIKSPLLDFYMYQSGHSIEEQELTYRSAEKFINAAVRRPVVNGEPCYEGVCYGFKYGRFKAFDIRKAFWQSLLGGAVAGFAYGAHGVWSWHRRGEPYTGTEFAGMPYDWRTAMNFRGAWDVSFGRFIFESFNMYELEPLQLILNKTAEIRMAAAKDLSMIVIYSPYNVDICIGMDLSGYEFTMIDLESRNIGVPYSVVCGESSVIVMSPNNNDTLYISIKWK